MNFTHKARAALAALAMTGAAGAATTNGIANGGFEDGGTGTFIAAGWLTAATGAPAQRSNDAHSGAYSMLLSVPNGFNASIALQDAFGHGGMPALGAANVGDTPLLSFWAKGDAAATGNAAFALRYMGANGILLDSGMQFFHQQINTDSWTQITFQAAAIPVGTTTVFLEIGTGVGPLVDARTNAVYIDDVHLALNTAPVPEPETYALLLAGLGVVAAVFRRRRA